MSGETGALEAWLVAIQDSGVAIAVASSMWIFPTVETLHVIALSLTLGSIAMLDLRLIGVTWRSTPVQQLARQVLPWTWVSFVAATVTGAVMFISNAALYGVNRAFQVKLIMIALAGVNMLYFHLITYRTVHAWGEGTVPIFSARLAGALSLMLWGGIVTLGRWVGFTL